MRTPTEDELVEQPAIDRAVLEDHGWASCMLKASAESVFREQLLSLASKFGVPAATRAGGDICEVLKPTDARSARPRSLSRIHSAGEFPLHVDTAHWLTPCRYLILACLTPGAADRPTILLDTQRLPLNKAQRNLLHIAPFRITNGRNSFFGRICSNTRSFVRYDPGCMTPISGDGERALDALSARHWPDNVEEIHWTRGKTVVVDNWRILHGRGVADRPDGDRTLLRMSIR